MKTLTQLNLQAAKSIFRSMATKRCHFQKNYVSDTWRRHNLNGKALIERSGLFFSAECPFP
jgi:hypothetical protein